MTEKVEIDFRSVNMNDALARTLALHFKELQAIMEASHATTVLLTHAAVDYKMISEIGYAVWTGKPIFVFHEADVEVPEMLASLMSAEVTWPAGIEITPEMIHRTCKTLVAHLMLGETEGDG